MTPAKKATTKKAAPKKAQPGRPILSVRVAPALLERMTALALVEGIELAEWVRAALLTETRRQERQAR